MPVMNGIEATKQIRALGVTIPIIGLTGDITKETQAAGLQSEMNELLLKPIKFTQFIECLRRWVCPLLGSRLFPSQPTLKVHCFQVS